MSGARPALDPLALHVAGLSLRLTLDDAPLRALLARRYAGFVDGHPTLGPAHGPLLHLHYRRRSDAAVLVPQTLAQAHLEGTQLRVGSWATLDRTTGLGHVEAHASMLALDVLLRAELTARVMEQGGLALHAAGVVVHGVAHVFAGPSGAGKSTVAQALHAEGATVLADEFLLVAPGANGRMWAWGTPFWRGTPTGAPIGSVWKLGRGSDGVRALAGPGAVMRQLVTNLSLVVAGAGLEQRARAAAARLCAQAKGFELRYVPGQPILSMLNDCQPSWQKDQKQ